MSSKKSRMAEKLARIVSGNYRPQDFIIADAKDGDMGAVRTLLALRKDLWMALELSKWLPQ